MRYRRLTSDGDYQFGDGGADYLVDSPEAVGQSVLTRLRLLEGEWFLDVTEGTPYGSAVLGKNTGDLYDLAIQQRVLEPEGVTSIEAYSSNLDPVTRLLTVEVTVNTRFGVTQQTVTF